MPLESTTETQGADSFIMSLKNLLSNLEVTKVKVMAKI
jgi:hypothetical protein